MKRADQFALAAMQGLLGNSYVMEAVDEAVRDKPHLENHRTDIIARLAYTVAASMLRERELFATNNPELIEPESIPIQFAYKYRLFQNVAETTVNIYEGGRDGISPEDNVHYEMAKAALILTENKGLWFNYECANCGTGMKAEEHPVNEFCSGCKNPNWQLRSRQEFNGIEFFHPDGKV